MTGPATKEGDGSDGQVSAGESRRNAILQEAVRFFAEVGTTGQTRELAKRVGVTQPLIYRYFETKKDLIEQVYESIYFQRWDPSWEVLICDRSIPIRDRLVRFYQSYTSRIFSYEWIRIYLYSGLEGAGINKRYIKHVERRILRPICAELRASNGLCSGESIAISNLELELVWTLHGGIFYSIME